uniref:Uncharacterized protein n=1 Tax=viral metagenome TaxID=1070528 RepID=A0A6M3LS57_9ZZZZ
MTELDLILERFEQYADRLIMDYRDMPQYGQLSAVRNTAKIEILQNSKAVLKRIINEVKK